MTMDIEPFSRRESMLKLKETLILSEEDNARGEAGFSIDEVASMMQTTIKETINDKNR
jgi:hypothetical protein